MSKRLFYTFSFLLVLYAMHAQKEANIWYFGYNAGLDFNTGEPVPLFDGQLYANEGTASIADANGQLLFYTNGVEVYNKEHLLMQNGSGLKGDVSTTQSAIIVPKPMSQSIYYIFTLMLEGYSPGLTYSEVDMSLNNGAGAITGNKNIPLVNRCTEQLTAVKHANGTDIWVITHGYANNKFHAYLVKPDGVIETPVTSNSGMVFGTSPDATVGCMKVSPQGTKLGICNVKSGIQLFDFNTTTGIVNAPLQLADTEYNYGLEFSPSGNVMYTSNQETLSITQYDLTAVNIPASATVVIPNTSPIRGYASIQLGPDRKIYITAVNNSYLSVIHNPNTIGLSCNPEIEGVFLGERVSRFGLPNFLQSFFTAGTIKADNICFGSTTEFSFISVIEPDSILWDFGDGNISTESAPIHTYAAAGNYSVSAKVNFDDDEEIIKQNITIIALPTVNKPEDMFACDDASGDEKESFNLSENKATILGNKNPADFLLTYHSSLPDAELGLNKLPENYVNTVNHQIVYVRVEDITSGCYNTTSFTLNVILNPKIEMEDLYFFCEKENVTITAPSGFDAYLWSTGETTTSITVNKEGTYTITVTQDNDGTLCHAVKTINVMQSVKPTINNIIIKEWTDATNSITVVTSGKGDNLYSIDGIRYQENPVFTGLLPGPYVVHVKDASDCWQIKKEIAILMYPRYFTPNGDDSNETWHIKYARYEPDMLVYIFDRYGKLITSLKATGPGWDGTLNGQHLPSTDYWFVARRHDGREYNGHFSMIR